MKIKLRTLWILIMKIKYALVDGVKREPEPKLKGVCFCCGSEVQAKCGKRNVWHWAHVSREQCDPWWENETEWHRLWKSYFSTANQEVVHFDQSTGEKHIADVKTDSSLVIEIQNSPMSETEMRSRESFYDNMVWIVNGEKFKKSFFVAGKLPDPDSAIAQELRFKSRGLHNYVAAGKHRSAYDELRLSPSTFHFRSENPDYEEVVDPASKKTECMVKLPSTSDYYSALDRINVAYAGHHLFEWKRPREVWSEATKPVFLDFGGEDLWRLMRYDVCAGPWCVRRESKATFIEANGGSYRPGLLEDSRFISQALPA